MYTLPTTKFLVTIVFSLTFYGICNLIASPVPFTLGTFWYLPETWEPFWWAIAPMLVWGCAINIIFTAAHKGDHPGEILVAGTLVSLHAGILEELVYRWAAFYAAIISVKIGDFLLGGFMFPHGLTWVFHNYVVGHIVNFTTFGFLNDFIFHPTTWAIGAGMIAVNATFRDGHKYQGFWGFWNSWFCGMYLFYVMFTYGLPAAIITHFLYDFIIFATIAAKVAVLPNSMKRVRL
jgi:hypothetical protein